MKEKTKDGILPAELPTQFTYIHFTFLEKSKSGKTDIYECYNTSNGTLLGRVSYYAGWYKYIFEPDRSQKLIFENQCLEDIATFTKNLTYIQRNKKKLLKDLNPR